MDILDLILKAREGQTLQLLGRHFQLSHAKVKIVLDQVVPMLGDAVIRLMRSPQGLAALLEQLASDQHQRDVHDKNMFFNPRVHSNGTGLLSLLLRNEPTIRVVAAVAAEAAKLDPTIVRRMMPYIASMYMSALRERSKRPLKQLADRVEGHNHMRGHSAHLLAQLVLSASAAKSQEPQTQVNRGSIKDILTTLSNLEKEEEGMAQVYSLDSYRTTTK